MRITITREPVPNDFPWNGSAGIATLAFQGNETEDYPAFVSEPTPTNQGTWGRVKTLYR